MADGAILSQREWPKTIQKQKRPTRQNTRYDAKGHETRTHTTPYEAVSGWKRYEITRNDKNTEQVVPQQDTKRHDTTGYLSRS